METEKKVWTKEEIVRLIKTSDKMVYRSLEKLYARQTDEEQASRETISNNGLGFNGPDAHQLTQMVILYRKAGYLGPRLLGIARARLPKYWAQLLEEANR